MSDRLPTIKDVAERPNVSLDTIRRRVWAKQITYINVLDPSILCNQHGDHIIVRFTEQKEGQIYGS